MPLVIPGITTNSADATQEWSNKLVGKTVSDSSHSETVSAFLTFLPLGTGQLIFVFMRLVEFLQEGSATGMSRNPARHDGDQGL